MDAVPGSISMELRLKVDPCRFSIASADQWLDHRNGPWLRYVKWPEGILVEWELEGCLLLRELGILIALASLALLRLLTCPPGNVTRKDFDQLISTLPETWAIFNARKPLMFGWTSPCGGAKFNRLQTMHLANGHLGINAPGHSQFHGVFASNWDSLIISCSHCCAGLLGRSCGFAFARTSELREKRSWQCERKLCAQWWLKFKKIHRTF